MSKKHIALLGTGFSRNWGGWLAVEAFEYLLGQPEVLADPGLKELLCRSQSSGGFESALAELQSSLLPNPSADEGGNLPIRAQLVELQAAVDRMFDDMMVPKRAKQVGRSRVGGPSGIRLDIRAQPGHAS